VPLIPAISLFGNSLVRAVLRVVKPAKPDPLTVHLRFNPTDYQIQKQNNFTDIAIPGLPSPPIQFVRGECQKLTAELLADTSDTLDNVRVKYTDPLRSLMDIDPELHAPPVVDFLWGDESFRGVVDSLNFTFQLFTPDGIPIRAKVSLTMKEYRPAEVQVRESPTNSPDVEKAYVVRAGDTLSSIAGAAYKDPGQWRVIARANDIVDPRTLHPGRTLTLPRLR
jgi:contractile injection system tube protein/LysM domain-containing protein